MTGKHTDADNNGRADYAEQVTEEALRDFEFCEGGPTEEDLATQRESDVQL